MDSNLGTLWFGADVKLDQLKKSINEGNKSILDALKMSYDPQSYQQMVAKLKQQFASETFQINVSTNAQSVAQDLRQSLGGIANGNGQIAPFDVQNIQNAQNGVTGIHRQVVEFTRKILDQKDIVKEVSNDVAVLRDRWGSLLSRYGRRDERTMEAYGDYIQAKKALREEQTALFALQQGRSRLNLTLAEQRVAYKEANEAVRQASANLAVEKRARIESTSVLEREKKSRIDATSVLEHEKMQRKVVQTQLEGERRKLDELRVQQAKQNVARAEARQAMRQQAVAARQLNTTLAGGIHISTQLGSALSGLFAAHAAQQFLHNVIEIGGQLEKQRISMGAIIGDTARANELFEQIKGMAVKSPFGVVELDQYSKQLAAYGIEQSKLFDMTKRLADISAGAGQDIGRLALALGHVKSATYLTGITLRQFSMNNIPMLKMLADYYSEVEKRAVSTAEVQKRISKREVSYEDVVEQIKRMTDEGGMFYNMQEKISESVAAKWKNLKDSLDIMYGDLAESKIGDMLKGTAEILMGLTTNWRTLMPVLGVAAGYFGVIKVSTLAMNTGLIVQQRLLTAQKMGWHENAMAASKYSVAQLRVIASMNTFNTGSAIMNRALLNLRIAFNGLVAGAKAAGAAIVAALPNVAILAGLSAMVGLWQKNREEIEKANSLADQLFERTQEGLKNVKAMMEETGMAFRYQYGNISGLFGKVPGKIEIPSVKSVDSTTMAKDIEIWQEFIKNYSATPNLMLQAAYALDENGKATKSLAEQYEALGKSASDVAESLNLMGKYGEYLTESINESEGWIDDNLLTDLKDYENEVRNYKRYAQDLYREHKKDAIAAVDAAMANADFAKAVEEAGIRSEDYASKLYKLSIESDKFKEASQAAYGVWRDLTGGSLASESLFQRGAFGAAERALDEEFGQVAERLKAKLESSGVDITKLTEPERLALTQVFTDMATKAGVSVDEAKAKIWELVTTKFPGIKLDINDVEIAAKTSAMKEELNNLVEGDFHIDIKTATNAFDVIKSIREGYKSAKDAIENAKPILLKLGLEASGMATMTDETIEKYAKGSEFVKSILTGVRDAQKQVNDALTASNNFGFSLSDPNKGGKTFRDSQSKNKTDQQLKEWKEQLKELENFYKVYKRNVEYMTKDDAIQKALDSGVFKISKESVKDIDDYLKVLKDFRDKVQAELGKKPSTERKSFLTDLLTKIDEKEFEVKTKQATETILKSLEREIETQSKKWDLYKKIFDATGNKSQAATIAFGNAISFDNMAEELRDKINKALEKLPEAKAEGIDKLLGMDDDQLKNLGIFEKSADGVYKMLKKLYDVEQSLKEEDIDLFLDALNNAKSLETELEQIRLKYDKTREAINKADNLSSEQKSSLLANTDKNQAIEEANKQWEWFKKNTEGWGEMFGNMDRMTTQAIEDMIQKLEEFIPNVQGSEEAIKAVYEALDKMHKAVSSRNPFKGLVDSVSKVSKLRELLKYMNDNNLSNFNAGVWGAKKFGLVEGQTYSKKQIENLIKGETEDFVEAVKGVQATFAALQDVLNPVIELFEVLGNTGLSRFFQIGSNAIGSAASAASGINALGGLFKDQDKGIGKLLGDAAPYVAGAAAGLSVISSLIAMHDQALQDEIDASKARVKVIENLSKSLEKSFERTLNAIQNAKPSEKESETLTKYLNAYKYLADGSPDPFNMLRSQYGHIQEDTANAIKKALESDSYYNTKLAELLIQRDEISKQLEAEKDKKDSDAGAIADYEAQLEDLNDQIENFALDMANALYNIDLKSWASDLTYAVVEAWENGEDAVDAYKKKVKDMMKDLLKTILAQRIMEQAFENAGITDLIKNLMTANAGNLDENAVIELANALGQAGEEGVNAITVILDKLEELGYISKEEAEETVANIDTIKSAFEDLLSDPTQDVEEWGKNFRNSLIQELVKNMLLGEEFEKWAADWNERVTYLWTSYNKNEISKDAFDLAMAELYKEFDDMAKGMTERGKKFYEDLGYVFDEAESEGIFDGLSDSWVSTLMDMSKTAEDWANEVGKTVAEQIIKQMVVPTMIQPLIDNLQEVFKSAMEAATTTDDEGNTSYDWEAVLNNQGLTAALNALSEKYPEIQEVVNHIMDALNLDTSNYKYDGFSNLADSIIDSLKSADGSLESWAAEQGKKMAEQMAKAYADTEYGDRIKQLNDEWQQALEANDVARMEEIRKELEKLYAEMGKDEKLKGLIEDFKELGTTVTSLSDSFVSSLMDISKTAEDWAQDLGKTIAEAIIKATVVPTLIQPLLQNVQDVFDSVIESATSLDADGKKVVDWKTVINDEGLMAAIQNVVDQYPELQSVIEKIMSAFGLKLHDNPFADMASTFTSSLMDMEASAESFGREISRMLTEQMINKVITEQFQSQIDALGEQWREALDNQDAAAIENIKNQLVALREQMGEAVQPLLDAISDIEKQADTTFSSMTDSWVSALMDMEGSAEDWAESVGKTMAQKIITEMIAPMYLQPVLDAMQKAWNAVISKPGATIREAMDAMTPFIGQVTSIYNELSPLIQEILNGFGIYAETVEEVTEEVEYALQDMKSTFVSSLMDMTSSAEDFSKNISKIMAEAFIKKFILGDAFDAQMKQWQERFEGVLGSGMSEDERKRQLKKLREEMVAYEESQKQYANALLDFFGLGASSEQEATMNMADKITYDQADQLLGINLAQELTLEQILATLRGGSMPIIPQSLLSTTQGQDDSQSQLILASLQSMSGIMSAGSDAMLTQVAMANSHLQLIRDYGKQIRDEVVMHLGSMDSKLSNLRNW